MVKFIRCLRWRRNVKNECIMNEKGIFKSGNIILEKRDFDVVFRKCILNIWVIFGILLWDDFSGVVRGSLEGVFWK